MGAANGPLVSVGLPVFNGERYLREAADSLLNQTFQDIELVMANNASTDRTEEICRQLSTDDPRVRYFRHDTNLGAAPNYNFTIDQARGEFFMWSAHDDLRDRTFIERALAAFEAFPDAAVVFSAAKRVDEVGEVLGPVPRPEGLTSPRVADRFRAAITCRHPALVVFGLMRKSVLNATGRHGAYPGADRVLAAELALMGPLVELEDALFYSRDHPNRYVRLGRSKGRDAQSVWWDSSRAGRSDIPALRRLIAYGRALRNSPMTTRDRWSCTRALVGALFDNRAGILRELGGDLYRAAVGSTKRVVSRRPRERKVHSP